MDAMNDAHLISSASNTTSTTAATTKETRLWHWRGNGLAGAGGFSARALAVIGYAARDGSARGEDEWIFGVRRWIWRRRRRPFSREVDLKLVEVACLVAVGFLGGGEFSAGGGGGC